MNMQYSFWELFDVLLVFVIIKKVAFLSSRENKREWDGQKLFFLLFSQESGGGPLKKVLRNDKYDYHCKTSNCHIEIYGTFIFIENNVQCTVCDTCTENELFWYSFFGSSSHIKGPLETWFCRCRHTRLKRPFKQTAFHSPAIYTVYVHTQLVVLRSTYQ